jgi:hypothetical protein
MKLEGVANATAGLVESIAGADQPSPSPTPFTLSYSFVTILVIVVAVVFLLLGILLYKVYDHCHSPSGVPANDDSHRWLTEDNPHKWVDSNYDEKKSDLPSALTKPRSSDSESDPNHKPGKRLHRQSISA